MNSRLAVAAALALTLGACATYGPGYSSQDGYRRDSYYGNLQVGVGNYSSPYWGGPYGDGYYSCGFPYAGFGYGPGYYPCDGFGYQPGYGGYPYGYFYDPWWYYVYLHRHHHHHGGDHDGDDDDDDHSTGVVRNDGARPEVQQFAGRNAVIGRPLAPANHPRALSGPFGDDRMQRPTPHWSNPWESHRDARQDFSRPHHGTDQGDH